MLLLSLFAWAALAAEPDPFAGIAASTAAPAGEAVGFWRENLGFRKEIYLAAAASSHDRSSSRLSLGFELLKKFSSATRTLGAINFQGRLVRRDRVAGMGHEAGSGWKTEHHNAYADVYGNERLNARVGRFYLPFGLNLQTDTHGTLLQLSNESNFGFERDWYAGFWGALNDHLNYDVDYLAGSGSDLKFRGQGGLGAGRVSLGSRYLYEHALEGGLSFLSGGRLDGQRRRIDTRRGGVDARWRRPAPAGTLTVLGELSGGDDDRDGVFVQLYQAEYLHRSRAWGLASQYRRRWQEGAHAEASLIGEATWYFKNDVASSSLHWLKANLEGKVEGRGVVATLQYYRYW